MVMLDDVYLFFFQAEDGIRDADVTGVQTCALPILGNSYGAGNYAMCGKAYDPRFFLAWPSAELAVMGGAQAAKVLLQIEASSLKAKGEELTPEKEAELFDKIKAKYDAQVSPYYAAARLWTDAIIDPLETRTWISMGIEAANH